MVIFPGRWITWSLFLLLLLAIAVSIGLFADTINDVEISPNGDIYYEDDAVEYKIIFFFTSVIIAFSLLLCWIASLISKVVISKEEIRSYKWYGRKTISFNDIIRIDRTKLFGGAIVIVAQKKSMMITLDNRGISHFVKFLSEQLGSDRTENATALIAERKKMIQFKEI
ncbi:hypothetical protein [Paenibacillus radicis (ex Gao et al. 2016)]|nr:hypothetical protein [Paenibacillus radicis (ex Gao et al. 2016)]